MPKPNETSVSENNTTKTKSPPEEKVDVDFKGIYETWGRTVYFCSCLEILALVSLSDAITRGSLRYLMYSAALFFATWFIGVCALGLKDGHKMLIAPPLFVLGTVICLIGGGIGLAGILAVVSLPIVFLIAIIWLIKRIWMVV